MIQRIKKPEIKPKIKEREKSPKREKPLINNKNVNNNVNNNNIVVNIPQAAPITPKRKRKPKPKITNTAKEDFQKTLNEYAKGNYPPLDNIPDITKIKTSAQINDITNQMKARMGTMGSTMGTTMGLISPTIPPPTIEPPTIIGPPTIGPPIDLSKPPASAILLENEKEFIELFNYFWIIIENMREDKDYKIKYLEGLSYYKLNKTLFDNITDDKVDEHINKYIEKDYFDMTEKEKGVLYEDLKEIYKDFKESSVIDKTKLIDSFTFSNKISASEIKDERKKLNEKVKELSDQIDKLKDSSNNIDNTDPLNEELNIKTVKELKQEQEISRLKEEIETILSEKNNSSIKQLINDAYTMEEEIIKNDDVFAQMELEHFYETLAAHGQSTSERLIDEKNYDVNLGSSGGMSGSSGYSGGMSGSSGYSGGVSGSSGGMSGSSGGMSGSSGLPMSSKQSYEEAMKASPPPSLAFINKSPELFYDTYYGKDRNKYKEIYIEGGLHPYLVELQFIIKELLPGYPVSGKPKALLIEIFKEEYLKSIDSYLTIRNFIPIKEPIELYQFLEDNYRVNGDLKDERKSGNPIKADIFQKFNKFLKIKNDKEINSAWAIRELNPENFTRLRLAKKFWDDFKKLYESQIPEPESEPTIGPSTPGEPTAPVAQEECLDSSRRDANCIKLSDYYRYLNFLSTNGELQEITDQYILATGDDFNFITANDNIKIKKIKESNYKPTGRDNPKFFDWAEKNKVPTSTTEPTTTEPITTEPITLTSENILQKYYKYLDEISFNFEGGGLLDEYVIATGDKFGGINRTNNYLMQKIKDSNYIPTKEKNRDFFRWYDNNQGITEPITSTTEQIINKPQTNENQVNLAYKITNVSYDDEDKPRRIDQLKLLDNYTSRNISVYQDGTTIYFCSTGSRAELSSQAAQDWFQSNIAILMGSPTGTLSSRFTEERKVLDELVSTLRPTIIIFCGHSLGGRLSNELFTYSIESKRNIYQPFSITFNAGSVFHTSFTDKYNNEYLQHRVLQFHANYDPLSATNTIGTVVNVPFTGSYPHSMTNFENVDYTPYKNFISEGLTFTETINPSYVVPEPIVEQKPEKETKLMDLIQKMYELEPSKRYNVNTEEYNNAKTYYVENREYFNTIDIEPFFRKYTISDTEFNFYMQIFLNLKRIPISVNPAEKDMGKDLKLMSYINQLWEMNRDNDYDTTETFTKAQEYYNTNREHFDTLNDNGRKQMLIIGYFDRQGTNRYNGGSERYPFFINVFDRLSNPTQAPNVENQPEYTMPYGGYIGAGVGALTGGITSGGNPIVAGGAGAAGFLAGNAIQNAIEGKPSAPQPIAPSPEPTPAPVLSGGGRRSGIPEPPPTLFKPDKPGTVYIPSTF